MILHSRRRRRQALLLNSGNAGALAKLSPVSSRASPGSNLFRTFESQTGAAKCHGAGVWPFRTFSVPVFPIPRTSLGSQTEP